MCPNFTHQYYHTRKIMAKSLKIPVGILEFCGTRYEQHMYRLNKKTKYSSNVSRFDGRIILKLDTRRTYWPKGRIISQIGKCP
jgi:hypothetical protein